MPPPPATAKPEAPSVPPAAAAKPAPVPPPPAPEPIALSAASGAKGFKAWLPALVSIVVAPAVTWGTVELVLVPRLKKKLDLPAATAAAAVTAEHAETTKDGKPKERSTYEFSNVVVNLAGTMGTRYLKTSFVITGDDKAGGVDVKKYFEENRTKMLDVTLNVLSALTLADLEEAGAKNVIREKLVSAYNQAAGKRVAEQVYFSDFVVQ